MMLLSLRNIKKDFGLKKVLKGINFDLVLEDRVGLVGSNGAGKTTLAEIISGNLKPDEGLIIKHNERLKIGYLVQSTFYEQKNFKYFNQNEDAYRFKDFFKISSFLGLKKVENWSAERLNKGLSGGERTKLALARIWAEKPDLLILDEPTNHLDLNGRQWLINELNAFKGAALVISHDRYFLDRTVNKIFELEEGRLNIFNGNYSFYRQEKKKEYEAKLHNYREQKKNQRKLEEQVRRLERWAEKAHKGSRKKAIDNGMKFGGKEHYRVKAKKMDNQMKAKKKRIEKLKKDLQCPQKEPEINFEFTSPEKRGRRIIEARSIRKSFGEKFLFEESSFYILNGERVGIFGENGSGKTTLLKMILGEEKQDKGRLWVSPSLKVAYLSQDVFDLDGNSTVLESIKELRGFYNHEARNLLANMGFDDEMLQKPVKKLSLGERTRLKLADLILSEYDCLLLDEPTNHLDLYSREQLEETLLKFKGTLLIVSHDRYLLERLCSRLLILKNGRIKRIEKGINEFLEQKEGNSNKTGEKIEERIMVIENRMAFVLSELEKYSPEDQEYEQLDREFKELVRERKELTLKK